MAVTYFPFDSLSAENRDRAANSQIFADYLKSFFSDGVFPVLDQFPNMHQLAVRASNPAGMSVVVDTGMGLISGRQYAQDAERTLQIPTADTSLPRKDRIVLRMDLNTQYRNNELYVVAGTAASSPQPPALTRNNVVYELALATISVAANATSITAADIADERANTDVCGYVTNVLGQVDTSVINAQFQAFFEQTQENTADWEDAQQAAFTAWFDTIKGQLGEDAAGNLQNQIGVLSNLTTSEKSNLVGAINEVNAKEPDVLDTMEEIDANTDAGKVAGALAVKELSSDFKLMKSEVNGSIAYVQGILPSTAGNVFAEADYPAGFSANNCCVICAAYYNNDYEGYGNIYNSTAPVKWFLLSEKIRVYNILSECTGMTFRIYLQKLNSIG